MKLYHGTTEKFARKAIIKGLKPRRITSNSNWKHLAESNPDMVYLTTTWAPYFANCAIRELGGALKGESRFALIEIDSELLDQSGFFPDEDYLFSVDTEKDINNGRALSLASRIKTIKRYRNHLDSFQSKWSDSVQGNGNLTYRGVIPPSAITRVSIIDYHSAPEMSDIAYKAGNISLVFYKIRGPLFRLLTKWFFGERVSADEWVREFNASTCLEDWLEWLPPVQSQWGGILANQHFEILKRVNGVFTSHLVAHTSEH